MKFIKRIGIGLICLTTLCSCNNTKPITLDSLYEAYVLDGGEQSYEEWFSSFKGEKGDTGTQGIQGEKGDPGEDGRTGKKGEKGDKGESGKNGKDGKNSYSITIFPYSNGSVSCSKGSYFIDDEVKLDFSPNDGYKLSYLKINNETIPNEDLIQENNCISFSTTMTEKGLIVEPVFSKINKNLKVIKVGLIGDSLTDMYDEGELRNQVNDSAPDGVYYDLRNYGVGGAAVTPDGWFAYNITDKYKASIDFAPDIITILLGSNDSPNWKFAKKRYISEYSKLLESYKAANHNVVINLLTSPSFGNVYQSHIITNEINFYQKEVADENGCRYYDFSGELMRNYFSSETYIDYFIDDIVHLSDRGNAIYTKMLYDAITNVDLSYFSENIPTLQIINENIGSSYIGFEFLINQECNILEINNIDVFSNEQKIKTIKANESGLFIDGLTEDTEYELKVPYLVQSKNKIQKITYSYTFKTLKKIKIAFIGDSLTDDRLLLWEHNGQTQTYAYTFWLEDDIRRLTNKETDFEIKNFGQVGASVTNSTLNYKTTLRYIESLQYEPDYVLVLLGSNDYNNWEGNKDDFIQSFQTLIDSYKNSNSETKFIILTSPPTLDVYSDQTIKIREEINKLQREFATKNDLDLWDLSNYIMDFSNSVDRPTWYTIFADSIHFNPTGSRMIERFIYLNLLNLFNL